MRPKFLPRGHVTTEEPPVEPHDFDEYDQLTTNHFAKSAIFVTAFVLIMAQVIAWVAGKLS